MAKRIIEMVRAKKASMKKGSTEATQNAVLASAAIHGGVRSPAWRNYMMQFVEQNPRGTPADPKQLERLLATDGTLGDPQMDLHRAYLLANGPCGSTTTDTFTLGVDTIDFDLSGGPLPDTNDLPPHPKGPRKRPSTWPK